MSTAVLLRCMLSPVADRELRFWLTCTCVSIMSSYSGMQKSPRHVSPASTSSAGSDQGRDGADYTGWWGHISTLLHV